MKKLAFGLISIPLFGVLMMVLRPELPVAEQSKVVIDIPATPKDVVESIEITPKATFGVLMESAGLTGTEITSIYEAAKPAYDLAAIRVGKTIDLIRDPNNQALKGVSYAISVEEELHVNLIDTEWIAERKKIDYEIKKKRVDGIVDSSLYAAGLAKGIDERAVIALADVFQWTVDFSQDVRVGDTFNFVYEELWRNGEYIMPGQVISAEYVNAGTKNRAYLYTNAKGEEGYYDENGGSLRKMFLKAPVAFKYITSGFTTGLRYVSAFNTSTGHRAIDYAAKSGTPIRATADGTVVMAGWNGPYGNMVSVRHNGTYTTNYAHQSKMAVKKGQKVSQGQIIGYVGSTGFSTGPHLHYEMVKYGTKINPLRETFPSTEPIAEAELEAFKKVATELDELLKNDTLVSL